MPFSESDSNTFECRCRTGCVYVGRLGEATDRDVVGEWCLSSGECCYQGDDLVDGSTGQENEAGR